jgi:hypothetical protein
MPAGLKGAQMKWLAAGARHGMNPHAASNDIPHDLAYRLADRMRQRPAQNRFRLYAQNRKQIGAGMSHHFALDQRREQRALWLDRTGDMDRLVRTEC